MNESVKKKWVEALRSGEYQKGRDQLKYDNKFCCLGVLCDLHAKETGGEWTTSLGENGFTYKGSLVWLPAAVLKWADLANRVGSQIMYQDDTISLSALNDHLQLSFNQIADLIKAQL